jgi:rhodanese-related sulfurtransferase
MPIINIDCKTLKKWLQNDEAVLVDVRELSEHQNNRIEQAQLIPLGEIAMNSLPELDGKKLVLHCHSGKRSFNACNKILRDDPDFEIYNLDGGIYAWNNCDFATIISKKKFLPIDRQVQLVIGAGVVLGVFCGYFLNINFIFLSGFFGAGLLLAGLTGLCPLANLIAKMPWNKGEKNYGTCSIVNK